MVGGACRAAGLLIETWPACAAVAEQAHRELQAAVRTAQRRCCYRNRTLGGRLAFLRNEAEDVLAALRKGRSRSRPMQACSLGFSQRLVVSARDLARAHCEGIYGAFRSGTDLGSDAYVL